MQRLAILLAVSVSVSVSVAAEPMVATGRQHALYLADDGTVWAWGANDLGQLGLGDTAQRLEPVQVPGLSGIVQVSAGLHYSLALRGDGTVFAWGDNAQAQLGGGAAGGYRTTPAAVVGGARQIAAGGQHALALLADGSIRAWGYNGSGCVGNGTAASPVVAPVAVSTASRFRAIAGGGQHSLAIRDDGTVWSWGLDADGQLGDGVALANATAPVLVSGLTGVMAVAAGNGHSLAVTAGGGIYAWGADAAGQLGDGATLASQPTPVSVAGSMCLRPAAGYASSLLMRTNGFCSVWGDNGRGQARQTPGSPAVMPIPYSPGTAFRTASTGFGDVVLAINGDGSVVAWGDNSCGQLGIGSTTPAATGTPVTVHATWPVARVTAAVRGQYNGAAATSDGTVWGWSSNNQGQVGDGTTTARPAPVQAGGLAGIIALSGGGDYGDTILAMNHRGQVWAWGRNDQGQVGDGTTATPRTAPVLLGVSGGWRGIAAGDGHSLAIDGYGNVRAWGSDTSGQLGDNAALASSTTPVLVDATAVRDILQVAAGYACSAALRADGTVWTWGSDAYGQLGDDAALANRPTPVQVSGLTGVVQIAAGSYHMLALRSNGTVAAWGWNNSGQLGDASTTIRPTPVTVVGESSGSLTGVRALAAGASHSHAIMADGGMRAWGRGAYGTLGDGGAADRSRPVAIALAGAAVMADGGYLGTVAVLADGTVQAWGHNGGYGIGDGTSTDSSTAVATSPDWLPLVTVDAAASVLSAGEAGPVHGSVRIVRTGSTAGSLGVAYLMGGTATAGADCTAPASIAIPWGQAGAAVAITVLDDHVDEADETAVLGLSAAPGRLRLGSPASATVTIADDDTAGILVSPAAGVAVAEAGGQAVIAVVLSSQPTADVTIPAGPAAGDGARIAVSPAALVFTPADWDRVQLITVTGLDDAIADGGHVATVVLGAAVSGDAGYAGRDPADFAVDCIDEDQRGAFVVASGGSTDVAEGGAGDGGTIVLTSQPTGVVAITLLSDGQAVATGPGGGSGICFAAAALGAGDGSTPADAAAWNTPVAFAVSAVDDRIAEPSPHAGSIGFAASGGGYDGVAIPALAVRITDDDVRGVAVSAPSGPTTEIGGTATFAVVLTSRPTGPVTIPVASGDPGQGTASPASLTFAPEDWQVAQTVTVTGCDGAGYDHGAGAAYTVVLGAIAGTSDYAGIDPPDAAMLNIGVNHPPTCDPIADVLLDEDAAPVAIVLTGIGAGQPGESQLIAIAVTSDAPGVVPDPDLVWPGSGGAGTADLQLAPAPGASGSATITVVLTDDGGTADGGGDTTVRSFRVTVGPVADAPVVILPGGGLAVAEQAPAAVVDPGASVSDADSAAFDGGLLRAGFGAAADAGDVLAFPGLGAGDTVRVGGIAIGIIDASSDGLGGRDLVVRFLADGSATPSRVGALLAQLTFATAADDPPVAVRDLAVEVDDGTAVSAPAVVPVAIIAVDDPPAVVPPAHPLVLVPGIALDGQVVATDPEGLPLAYALDVPPAQGVVDALDPATGAFTYRVPAGCTAAADAFSISVDDGANLVTATIAVRITQAGTGGPVITSLPPMSATAGGTLAYVPAVSTAGLVLPSLRFVLIGSLPGAVLDPATGAFSWPVAMPADGSGYAQGGILVVDDTSGTAGFQPVTIQCLPGSSG